jgi:ribosomal protein L11 methyltransferase
VTWALHTDLPLDEVNVRLASVDVLGMVETEGRTTVYVAERDDSLPLTGRWEAVPDRDWNAAWKEGLQPVTVGAVTIVPPWLDAPAGSAVVLVIEPAQAFGTGHHETTTMCLATLQEVDVAGRSVFDVGTGTGVLALAAAKLGASRALACDIDPAAVATAEENALLNGVDVEVRVGSVGVAAGERFDIVVANLDTATLVSLAGSLVGALAEGGTLIASGVSLQRAAEAVTAFRRAGLDVQQRAGDEWVVLLGRRS